MSIEAVSAVAANVLPAVGVDAARVQTAQPAGGFDAIVQHLEGLNAQMLANQERVQTLATGDAQDLHRVMMALEMTKLEFELTLQVRNKVLEAYQELMRMQV